MKSFAKEVGNDISKIQNIATISANNDEFIGALIADAMNKVKRDGIITVQESKGIETYTEVVEGMQFDRGFASPYFCTDTNKMVCEFDNPIIALFLQRCPTFNKLIPILEYGVKEGRPILIIAEDFDNEVLSAFIVNKLRGGLKACLVKSPSFGERKKDILEDIAAIIGCPVHSEETGMNIDSFVPSEDFGSAEKVLITKDSTTIINGKGDKEEIEHRISLIKNQIAESTSSYDSEKLQERLGKLSGGVAVLYVGANSEIELKEKKDRVDDALCATKAAVEEGIVPGGGVAYLDALVQLDDLEVSHEDEKIGVEIVKWAIQEPIKQILYNAGLSAEVIIDKILYYPELGFGYNAKNNQYCNLFEEGIIDPLKVVRVALENAASAAGMVLTTECVIYESIKEQNNPSIPQM